MVFFRRSGAQQHGRNVVHLHSTYRVKQQSCPGGNLLKTLGDPPWGDPGGLQGRGPRIFCLNHWQIQKKKFKQKKFKISFGSASDLAKKSGKGISGRFSPGQHCWFTWYFSTYQPIAIQLDSQHCQKDEILIMLSCDGAPKRNQMVQT